MDVPPLDPNAPQLRAGLAVVDALTRYHRHSVVGLENVPVSGPVLLVVNHSLATYDIALLTGAIFRATGRPPRGLGDRAMFEGPDRGRIARSLGFVQASPGNGEALLARNELVVVAPGGMREALRPSHARYQVEWSRRKGFVRLALATRTPIVLAACPQADRVYHVYENRLTKLVYKKARLPVPLARGWGPTLIPRPVKLTHHLSELLRPPEGASVERDADVDVWHAELVARMNQLMSEARG